MGVGRSLAENGTSRCSNHQSSAQQGVGFHEDSIKIVRKQP
jgi:hypothetical protein